VTETNPPSEFKVTFGLVQEEEEVVGETVQFGAIAGFGPEDLEELSSDTGARVTVRPGSVGVGASALGIELVLAFANPGSVLALIQIGEKIKAAISRIQARRARPVTISDPSTMTAIAAASAVSEVLEKLHGTRFLAVRNLSGGDAPPNWAGTDSRHIWAVVFEHETQGWALVIFMSPSGLFLGQTEVPVEMYWDGVTWQSRKPEDIAQFNTEVQRRPRTTSSRPDR
jgi:hypothetical protein